MTDSSNEYPLTAISQAAPGRLRQELIQFPPFSLMDLRDVDWFVSQSTERRFSAGEMIMDPTQGVVQMVYWIRQGAVTGVKGLAEQAGGAFLYESGDLFPVNAAMSGRPVTASYRANIETFMLAIKVEQLRSLADRSQVFADFLAHRMRNYLELSRRALQASFASQALAEQSLETPLGEIATRVPVACPPDTQLKTALERMHQERVGSMLVTGSDGGPVGILTRHDLVGRIILPGISLESPIATVMVEPVLSLDHRQTAQDAVLLMSSQGIRHVPVTREGKTIGVVSERDLFALQRLSLKQVGDTMRNASSINALRASAKDIRRLARALLGQGVQARQLTLLISHLNDLLTQRLIQLVAESRQFDLTDVCWMALGSEGRSEQTIATDQDNALILSDEAALHKRKLALDFAADINEALDACGFPLCKGGIMAREPECCLSLSQWRSRFDNWIEGGSPEDLLRASIYFDFRPLGGKAALADSLRSHVTRSARKVPRFHKQLALNALAQSPPLNWRGAVDVDEHGGVDLKLQGTTLFVDAARILALAQGVEATSTRDRLVTAGQAAGVIQDEYESWATSFEYLQMLRLRVQLDPPSHEHNPNWLALARLNAIDRRILRETFRVARSLQQRLQLDYQR